MKLFVYIRRNGTQNNNNIMSIYINIIVKVYFQHFLLLVYFVLRSIFKI